MTLSIELHSIRSLNESSEPSASDELYVLVAVASVRPPIVGLPIPAIQTSESSRMASSGTWTTMTPAP